ncbi:nuclease-related domain-containing protein [Planococcus sp. X10-3]|uniref:nuclease-related domain-containing protein n=1 Tax=Planococcus sp. X10-3 TaxID=3061240 RepID=UPI003BB01ECB
MFAIVNKGVATIIIKHRKRPIKIAGYEALLKRLPVFHAKRELIGDIIKSSNAGFGGEERLDYLMKQFEPDYPYLIIQDLSVSTNMDFQIDTLLLTQSCTILLEVKNISGRLRFCVNPSALHQTTSTGQEKGYKSPLVQMEVAKWKFEKLLESLDVSLPVYTFVVIAYPNQIVENTPPGSVIWSADEVVIRLQNFKMPNDQLSIDEMHKVGQQLLSVATEYNPFPLAPKHNINARDIGKGVYCPNCESIKMNRIKRSWHCPSCKLQSLTAHHEAIQEWFMLIKSSISAAECKDFLELEHLSTARNMLVHPNYQKIGSNKKRRYFIKDQADIHET